jgi:hypothetical protein
MSDETFDEIFDSAASVAHVKQAGFHWSRPATERGLALGPSSATVSRSRQEVGGFGRGFEAPEDDFDGEPRGLAHLFGSPAVSGLGFGGTPMKRGSPGSGLEGLPASPAGSILGGSDRHVAHVRGGGRYAASNAPSGAAVAHRNLGSDIGSNAAAARAVNSTGILGGRVAGIP